MFSLALHQNQNNASVLKSRLEAIVPHAFGTIQNVLILGVQQ